MSTNPFDDPPQSPTSANPVGIAPIVSAQSVIATNPFLVPSQAFPPPRSSSPHSASPHSSFVSNAPAATPSVMTANQPEKTLGMNSLSIAADKIDLDLSLDASVKSHLIQQVITLQQALRDKIHKIQDVQGEITTLTKENQVLEKYIQNLAASTNSSAASSSTKTNV